MWDLSRDDCEGTCVRVANANSLIRLLTIRINLLNSICRIGYRTVSTKEYFSGKEETLTITGQTGFKLAQIG